MTSLTKEDIIAKAGELGFEDVGFTTAEPFDTHLGFLKDRKDEYGWTEATGLKLMDGTDPKTVMAGARTIIVLMEVYFRKRFPRQMEGHFGRCYLDDDRVTKDGLSRRIKAFRSFLRDSGIDSKVPFNLPHRVAAKEKDFRLFSLLNMDESYFTSKIWPHMFYMGPDRLWQWKMNVARAMGNTRDTGYAEDLIQC